MKWSWRIGRVAGIDLYVHATFLILLAYVALSAYRSRGSWVDAYGAVLFVGSFFCVVVLHELGHCLTARRFGIGTHDITQLPIGGVARLERLPEKPAQELVIALAGPAVNVVIGLLLYFVLRAPDPGRLLGGVRLVGGELLVNLFYANGLMAVFNLVPAFPMDGGRVLRALLALRQDFARATDQAATVGQALAWGFGSIALFTQNWWLLIIAVFVVLGAEAEADFVRTKSALAAGRVADMMIREFRVLSVNDPLHQAVQHALAGFQQDFPVVDGGKVVGVLTRRRLLAGLTSGGENARVGDYMLKDFRTAFAWESTAEAFQRLQDCDCHAMPVLQDGQLVGVLTTDNLGEYVMIRAALRGDQPPRKRP
jgi:Zn-dependent protease